MVSIRVHGAVKGAHQLRMLAEKAAGISRAGGRGSIAAVSIAASLRKKGRARERDVVVVVDGMGG